MSGATNERAAENEVGHSKIETFDDILPHIGAKGRYQIFLFVLLMPFLCSEAFLFYSQFFITLTPDEHWCRVPEFDNANLSDRAKIELSIPPRDDDTIPFSQCQMYARNYTQVLLTGDKPRPDTPIVDCQHGWSYNLSTVPYMSIASELEWVCERAYLTSTSQSLFFAGGILGSLVYGYIADHYGRVPAVVLCNSIAFIASIASAFADSFWTFVVARFIVGTVYDSCHNIIMIIVIEYVAPKYRTLVINACFGLFWLLGSITFPWLALWIANWKLLSVVAALPLGVAFVAPWIVPESARWYVQTGQVDKAIEVLKRFAKVNGKSVRPEIYEEFRRNSNKLIKDKELEADNLTVLDIFKYPRLRRIVLVVICCWIQMNFIYIGHISNMQLLHQDVFVSYSLGSITEFFAALILALSLDRLGRRWMGFLSMFVGGVFSFVVIAMPVGAPAMWCAIVARLGPNIGINMNYQYSAEILPTVVRAQGIAFIHIIGFATSLLGPHVALLATVHASLPFVLLGSSSLLSAVLLFTLPETMGEKLPESLEEGNDFGRGQKFWWFPWDKDSLQVSDDSPEKSSGAVNAGFSLESIDEMESTRI